MKYKLICFFALFFAVVSCTNNYVVVKNAEEESNAFVSESLACYVAGNLEDSFHVRFYDGNRYMPYVGFRYFSKLFNIDYETSCSDGKYTYVLYPSSDRIPVVVDTKNDTIRFSSWKDFSNFDKAVQLNEEKLLKTIKMYFGEKERVFDLSKYGFKIYGGVDDAYVPLCVLANIFAIKLGGSMPVYNGESIYVGPGGNAQYDSDWYNANRPEELIRSSYNLLCLVHDCLNGHSGYYGFADDGSGYPDAAVASAADALGFDALMTRYAPETKAKLLSPSWTTYAEGMFNLCMNDYGDRHSGFMLPERYLNKFEIKASNKCNLSSALTVELNNKRKAATLGTCPVGYIADLDSGIPSFELSGDGKTAIIRFDSFKISDDNWWKRYADTLGGNRDPDPSLVEIPNDTLGLFYKSFYALENDASCANVKNVIIDLSKNTGGAIYCMEYALNFILDSFDIRHYDVISGGRARNVYSADLNLDGVIDNHDAAKRSRIVGKYNFAVLTSFVSFSCGNAFAAVCAENGMKIIGQRSGGGSCAVGFGSTLEGFMYNYSSAMRISVGSDWTSVEGGVIPDKTIENSEDFYDKAKLSAVMSELFPE